MPQAVAAGGGAATFAAADTNDWVLYLKKPGATPASPAPSDPAILEVPRWQMHEFVLQGRAQVGNPFRDAALVGEFTAPSGKVVTAEGFYDSEDTWRLRFTPGEEGEWRYLLRGEGVEVSPRGRLRCTAPRGQGFIGIHPDNPYAFAYAVRMGVVHSPTHWDSDRHFWPWGGTPKQPDLDRFHPAYFQGLDAVLRQMQGVGMNAELIVLNFYQRPFTDTKLWTPAREQQWLRYLAARYAAFPNLFLWTVSWPAG